jgi:cysteine desulfurase family protein (TIGR01976 family)
VSATALDLAALRDRFPALRSGAVYLDGPGGSQVPESVIEAMARTLREENANLGGAFDTSVAAVAALDRGRAAAADFTGSEPEEIAFGPNMTTLNFLLAHAVARTMEPGDEIVVTALDHDANVAPWLELAHDLGIVVRVAGVTDDLRVDYDDLTSKLSGRTRVVAFPVAANSVGTAPDVVRIVGLAREAGALAWADAVHYAPHGPIDVSAWDVDVLICSPYKFFGPHLGLAFGKRELLESWRPYKVRPAANEPIGHRFELGTLPHELLAGFVAAVEYVGSVGWDAILPHELQLGQRFLDGLPDGIELYGLRGMDGRVPTFCFNVPGRSPEAVAVSLAERDLAVWHGNYYALETMRHLGLDDGAVRAGIVHYNTEDEVDRLLTALADLV